MYLQHLRNTTSVKSCKVDSEFEKADEKEDKEFEKAIGDTEHRMCQLFKEELLSVNRLSNSKFVGESPESTLSMIAADGTNNQMFLFNQICSMVEFRVQKDPKLVTAQDKVDGLVEELNKGDLLGNYYAQREMMLDPIRYAQHLSGGEMQIKIDEEKAMQFHIQIEKRKQDDKRDTGEPKKDEAESQKEKKPERPNVNPGQTTDSKDR